MKPIRRRRFLKSGFAAALGASIFPNSSLFGKAGERAALEYHTISKAEFKEVDFHWPRFVGKNGRIDDHGQHKKSTVLELTTQQGAKGWGMSSKDAEKGLDQILNKPLSDLISQDSGLLPNIKKDFDFALHDLMGVVLNKPVYELLGSHGPMENPIYSGMIYLDELNADNPSKSIDRVLENCQWDYDYGYRQFKIKIGRSGRWYPHDEGLAKDIEVVKAIYDRFKNKGVQLLVDSNDMYSLHDTKEFLLGIGDLPLLWFEEPFRENRSSSLDLRKWMDTNGFKDTLYADGEARPNHEQCMALAKQKIIDVYLNDIYGYGFTNWRKLMPELEKMGTLASPHAWGSLLKTHYTAHLASGLGNVVTIEGVTCFSEDIDYGDYGMVDGKLVTSKAPGFGMKLLV